MFIAQSYRNYSSEIHKVIIKDGITSLAEGVATIGEDAFSACEKAHKIASAKNLKEF